MRWDCSTSILQPISVSMYHIPVRQAVHVRKNNNIKWTPNLINLFHLVLNTGKHKLTIREAKLALLDLLRERTFILQVDYMNEHETWSSNIP